MTKFMHIRAENSPDSTGVAETPALCMGVAEMPSVCTGVAETPIDCSRLARTPPLTNKKWSGLMTTLGKKRHLRS